MNESTQYHPAPVDQKSAVTLVAHGLNTRPSAMLPLVEWLNLQGSEVYLVRLTGHYEAGTHMAPVPPGAWQEEMQAAYALAKRAATTAGLPLYFLGYSMGALLAQSVLALGTDNAPFQKQVLLAPAIALRRRVWLLRPFCAFAKQVRLPSYTPKPYRAKDRLPLAAYRTLFAEAGRLRREGMHRLNFPTLVVLDPQDEFISYRYLLWMIGAYGLTHYQVLALEPGLQGRSQPYHHLILDEATMGKENWKKATEKMKEFLF